ncbi:hypothetical protein EF294_03465 [Gordonia oryzae]|uniref:Uncharacterized protein n=1 Tax=Gordonia oryzae TaxID=2487349 RepID=A0A3N4GY92_9ACTN|nr:hypothetical protein [Gordonia oryzae]RPA65808.1 hypothetical protein EF294_03465 [Gordonia oryzae]
MIYGNDSGTFSVPSAVTQLDKHFQPINNPATVSVQGLSMQPVSTSEVISNTDLTIDDSKLLIPATQMPSGITTECTYTPTGSTDIYQIVGEPRPWTNRLGIPHHTTVYLRKARATSGA